MQIHTLTIHFPYIESFFDYHEIDVETEFLNRRIDTKKRIEYHLIDISEYGYLNNGKYYNIFYVGKKPSNEDINNLLSEIL